MVRVGCHTVGAWCIEVEWLFGGIVVWARGGKGEGWGRGDGSGREWFL